jgi:hypothetical protein
MTFGSSCTPCSVWYHETPCSGGILFVPKRSHPFDIRVQIEMELLLVQLVIALPRARSVRRGVCPKRGTRFGQCDPQVLKAPVSGLCSTRFQIHVEGRVCNLHPILDKATKDNCSLHVHMPEVAWVNRLEGLPGNDGTRSRGKVQLIANPSLSIAEDESSDSG